MQNIFFGMAMLTSTFYSVKLLLPHKKPVHRIGMLALLCACAFNQSTRGIQIFHFLGETTVADVAITLPKLIATCPHHPHGCPRDCMCPKTYIHVGEDGGEHAENPGALHEPALVTCTERGPQSLTPSFAVFLPETSLMIQHIEAGFSPWTRCKDVLPNPLQEPPQKIPIV